MSVARQPGPVRLGVLISGRGSNMLALAEATASGRIPRAVISVIVSDQPRAAGIALARERGLAAVPIERRGLTREEHEQLIIRELAERRVELVCLAGYMRLFSPNFIDAYRDRIINIHPSLLPAFPGLHAQRQALEHGVKWTGCTVHLVDETLDGGPIIIQKPVPVYDDDSEETLSARILEQEHRIYPEAVAVITSGLYRRSGRRIILT